MSSEEQQQQQPDNRPPQQQQPYQQNETYYQRKKNWIGGIDNDSILGGGLAIVGLISAIAAYPVVRDLWNNFTLRMQQQQAIMNQQQNPYLVGPNGQPAVLPNNNGEQYIPPTPPNANGIQGTPPIVETPQQQQQQQPVQEEEEQQPQQEGESDDDELFHEQELKKKQRLMGMKARGRKYESPFGAHIGGLG